MMSAAVASIAVDERKPQGKIRKLVLCKDAPPISVRDFARVTPMQLLVTRDAPCYWQCLPVSVSRPIVLLQDLSSCRMTHRGHEVPVFTVQSPALNVVPLLPRVAEQYPHKFQMLCIAAASKANRPDGHWDYFCRPSRHRACAKHICVCLSVCLTVACMHVSIYV